MLDKAVQTLRRWILFLLLLVSLCGCPRAQELFSLSPSSATFTVPLGGTNPTDQVVTVVGDRKLPSSGAIWTVTSDRSWLVAAPASGIVHAGERIPLSLHIAETVLPESWLGSTSTVGAPFVDMNTYAGWGAWVGHAMLIWGGDPTVPAKYYDPVTDTWFGSTSTAGMPSLRLSFSAVWTGTEMLVWGGYDPTGTPVALNTGARYNPSTDTWTPMSTTGAPSPRTAHRAIWTGAHMIVWGGDGLGFTYTNTGGIYDPATDTWLGPTSTLGAPSARGSSAVVWTGSRMIVWGGENPGKFNTGYFYDPGTDSWTGTTTAVGAPSARSHMPGVWTGREMIIWGGSPGAGSDLDTGARYDPITDTWVDMTLVGAPAARSSHVLVWTGSAMIAWGGVSPTTNLNTGAIYQPPGLEIGSYSALITVTAQVGPQVSVRTLPVGLTVTP